MLHIFIFSLVICLLVVFFYLYFLSLDSFVRFINFISFHRLVFSYYFLNILIFFVGLNAVFHYNNMTAQDFMNDFKEFKVLYEVFKTQLLPELFPSYYQ